MTKFKQLMLLGIFLFPLTVMGQDQELWNHPRTELDLANFLNAKLIPGYNFESDLTFPFWKGRFPEMEINSPATAQKFLGEDYKIGLRWFDTDLNEVDTLMRPGRYGYYAEVSGDNGIVLKRAGTMFCTPSDWMGWSEAVVNRMDYFPFDQVPQKVWEQNSQAISAYSGQIVLESMINHRQGGILLSYIHDMHVKGLEPGPYHTPVIMDGDYHIKLKLKVLGLDNEDRKLDLPAKADTPGKVLRLMDPEEKEKAATFVNEMNSLCQEWAEESGEPFDMLVAKDGMILFHGAFGENLRGKFTLDQPTEIASITKLYTGLLFAQFLDQGLVEVDDYVGEHLPDFPISGEKAITLRQCFTHTTGFYGHGSMGGVQNPWLDNSLALWLPYLKPGTKHWYNGMGYNLAGKVMEINSGKSIFHLMHEYLFAPLGLKHTYLDIDLAYGINSTAYDMAVVGQMLLNKGSYGDLRFFSEETFEALLPVDLETFYPAVKGRKWGIGITPSNHYIRNESGEKRNIVSDHFVGHGSATSSILNVDLENGIVITQSRMDDGKHYHDYLNRAYLLIEKHHKDF